MADQIKVYGPDGYVDHWGHVIRLLRKERGSYKTESGFVVPKTTKRDVRQLAQWYNTEVDRLISRRGHHHPTHDTWKAGYSRVMSETAGADLDVEYAGNAWFWSELLRPLVVHMEGERATPTRMELIIESIEEAVDDRIDDAKKILGGAADAAGSVVSSIGDAAEAVADTGKSVWTAVKVVAVVGVVGIGAALIVPPIVRAARARDLEPEQTEEFHP